MTSPNYPGNSKSTPPTDPKKVEKVITGTVQSKPKTLGKRMKEALIGGDSKSALQYVITEVIIPQAKDMIAEAATQAFERLIFGDGRSGSRRNPSRTGYTNYSRYSSTRSTRPIVTSGREERTTITLQNRDMDDLIFETRPDAQAVLEQMFEHIEEYAMVSKADLYAMLGKSSESTHIDHKWGWEDLQRSEVRMVRGGGYLLHLPKVISLE